MTRHKIDSVRNGDEEANQACMDETKCLLSLADMSRPSYDSLSQNSDFLDGTMPPQSPDEAANQVAAEKPFSTSFALLISSVVIVAALFSCSTLLSGHEKDGTFPQMMLSDFVFAPNVADTTTTFQGLAQSMVPSWYNETVSHMPIFTLTVQPDDVYKTRKILLKTRDLLDVFSPVYPNTTIAATEDNTNMWRLIRHYLNQGYMIVGEFQDLHNAHVMYSQEQMEELRDEVLEWKREFDQFRETHHDAVEFLESPTTNSYQHKESRLFWQNAETLPSGRDSATDSLGAIGTIQLNQVLEYLWLVYPYASVLDEDAHQHYHNLRKELRSVVDEFELFGSIMFPSSAQTDSAMTVLMRARKLLGDINDDWTAYSIYVENDEYYSEQARLAKEIDDAWAYFQVWVHETNFEGAIQYLLDSLHPTMPGKSQKSTVTVS